MDTIEWFSVNQVRDNVFLIREEYFVPEERCNIWLVKGENTDVIIDTGLGLHNLSSFLEEKHLIKVDNHRCIVVCTHIHFDHTGGAHHFDEVYIHENEAQFLSEGNGKYILNIVSDDKITKKPAPGFKLPKYHVPKTECLPLKDKEVIPIGEEECLEVLHLPGHSTGSIALYYGKRDILFAGDIVYNCGHGSGFLDFLPSSEVSQYVESCNELCDFISHKGVQAIFSGHYEILTPEHCVTLLKQYVDSKKSIWSSVKGACMRVLATLYLYQYR